MGVFQRRGQEYVGRCNVGGKTGILLVFRPLRLSPKNKIALDFPNVDEAGGGRDQVDALETGIIANIADAVEEGALDAGVVLGDD